MVNDEAEPLSLNSDVEEHCTFTITTSEDTGAASHESTEYSIIEAVDPEDEFPTVPVIYHPLTSRQPSNEAMKRVSLYECLHCGFYSSLRTRCTNERCDFDLGSVSDEDYILGAHPPDDCDQIDCRFCPDHVFYDGRPQAVFWRIFSRWLSGYTPLFNHIGADGAVRVIPLSRVRRNDRLFLDGHIEACTKPVIVKMTEPKSNKRRKIESSDDEGDHSEIQSPAAAKDTVDEPCKSGSAPPAPVAVNLRGNKGSVKILRPSWDADDLFPEDLLGSIPAKPRADPVIEPPQSPKRGGPIRRGRKRVANDVSAHKLFELFYNNE